MIKFKSLKMGQDIWVLIFSFVLIFLPTQVLADPPGRVARLSQKVGSVSFLPSGSEDWLEGIINRPLTLGDRLWVGDDGLAELQLGGPTLCVGARTNLSILNLDDRIAQFQVTEGSINIRIRKISPDQVVEIDTPNLAFVIQNPGHYRVDVDPEAHTTIVKVFRGEATIYGENATHAIKENEALSFDGSDLTNLQVLDLSKDDFDHWCFDRDKKSSVVTTNQYVSSDVIGYEDLETNGVWTQLADYGPVWYPSNVADDWVPYQSGSWSWIDPWGWTWIDEAPWGFAPYHYGRWLYSDRWYWVPGPYNVAPFYAAALVGFLNLGANIGWFPLGPFDYFWPPYPVGINYFININAGNIRIDNRRLTNIYRNHTPITRFGNLSKTAVTAVPRTAFRQGTIASRALQTVPNNVVQNSNVHTKANVEPLLSSVTGHAKTAIAKPSTAALERETIAKNTPPKFSSAITGEQGTLREKNGVTNTIQNKTSAGLPRPNIRQINPSTAINPSTTATKALHPGGFVSEYPEHAIPKNIQVTPQHTPLEYHYLPYEDENYYNQRETSSAARSYNRESRTNEVRTYPNEVRVPLPSVNSTQNRGMESHYEHQPIYSPINRGAEQHYQPNYAPVNRGGEQHFKEGAAPNRAGGGAAAPSPRGGGGSSGGGHQEERGRHH